MKRLTFLILVLCLFLIDTTGQTPQSFKYQAVARDAMGEILENQNINIRVTIIDSTTGGTTVYSEVHKSGTNSFGLFTIEVGRGVAPTGNFSAISWQTGNKWMQIEMDPVGGTNFTVMGISELLSVPYALFSGSAANVDDADANPTNEIQTLSLSGNEISISGGNTITLPSGTVDTDDQNLALSGTTLSIDDGNSVDLSVLQDGVNDADSDPGNEIQTLSLSGSDISISGGNTITLPSGTIDTDDQNLALSGTTLSIDDGNSVDLSVLQDGVDDADNDPGNELNLSFVLDTAAKELTITDAGGSLTVDVTSLLGGGGGSDNDWSINGNDMYNSNSGNVGIGNNAPSEKLSVSGNVLFSGALMPANDAGSSGQFLISQGPGVAPAWQTASGNDDGDWVLNGDDMYNNNIGNIGIGTTAPLVKLHVEDSNGVLMTGTYGLGSIPTTGSGTRLMWYPGKAAFRVGYVSLNKWDDINIGKYSFATGNDTKANGDYSTALGSLTNATGSSSTALGLSTNAAGNVSTAIGASTNAIGDRSTAMGFFSNAVGNNSTALGQLTIAHDENTIAAGFQSSAKGGESVALGNRTSSNGQSSFAMGDSVVASGDYTTALGYYASTNNMTGSFVYGDNSTTTKVVVDGVNRFMVRAAGGYVFYTNSTGPQNSWVGAMMPAGGNSWATISDVNRKENFKPINGEQVLAKIADFNLSTWNYKGQDPVKFRHYGPMAQDFYEAFGNDGIGNIGSSTYIASADFQGINFTAIQALEERTRRQSDTIAQLQSENRSLKQRLINLEIIMKKWEEGIVKNVGE